MREPGGDGAAGGRRDLDRDIAVLRAVVAELAVGIPPPGPDRAVGFARERVKAAGCDRRDARQARHLHGRVAVLGTAVAELAYIIEAPGPDRSIALESDHMLLAGRNRRHARQASGLLRGACDDGFNPVAEQIAGTAPGKHRAVMQQNRDDLAV